MLYSQILGRHCEEEGITVHDLWCILGSFPYKARGNYIVDSSGRNITGVSVSQSDQAGKWDLKFRIEVEK